jgi:hypothetical protein
MPEWKKNTADKKCILFFKNEIYRGSLQASKENK